MAESLPLFVQIDGREVARGLSAGIRSTRVLPDVGRYHSRNTTDTEKAAAEAAPVGTQRERVLAAYKRVGDSGLTDEECSVMARIRFGHVAGTRREELVAAGVPIADSGGRRLTTSRRLAVVWTFKAKEDG